MKAGVWLAIASLISMSVAPVCNKFASGATGLAWGAALNSSFCLLIGLLTQPKLIRASSKLFSKALLRIALSNSAGLVCLYAATWRLDPATLSILGRLYVVFSTLLSLFVLRERSSLKANLAVALVLFGAIIFSWSGSLKSGSVSSELLGIALCLGFCFFFAWTHMQIKIESEKIDSNTILFANNLLSTLFVVPFAAMIEGPLHLEGIKGPVLIFAAAFFSGWLGLLLFYESLRRISLSQANFIRAFSPVVGVLIAWPFFPFHFTPAQIVGALLMAAALFIRAIPQSDR